MRRGLWGTVASILRVIPRLTAPCPQPGISCMNDVPRWRVLSIFSPPVSIKPFEKLGTRKAHRSSTDGNNEKLAGQKVRAPVLFGPVPRQAAGLGTRRLAFSPLVFLNRICPFPPLPPVTGASASLSRKVRNEAELYRFRPPLSLPALQADSPPTPSPV